MSSLLGALRAAIAWWLEGLTRLGAHLTHVYDLPLTPVANDADTDADCEAWDQERARLALSPWWL